MAAPPATYADGHAHRRFTVAEYNQLRHLRILDARDEVELMEGWLVVEPPRGPVHDRVLAGLHESLAARLPAEWVCRCRLAVTLSTSQPNSDAAVVRGTHRDYESHHPLPSDVGLAVEVANSSLQRDTLDKTRVYAADAIPGYWVVDVVNRRVEVYSAPAGGKYTGHRTYLPGESPPLELDGFTAGIPVTDFLR